MKSRSSPTSGLPIPPTASPRWSGVSPGAKSPGWGEGSPRSTGCSAGAEPRREGAGGAAEGPGTAVVCIDPETSTAGGRADRRRRQRQRDRPPVGAEVTLPRAAAAAVPRRAGAPRSPASKQQVSGHDGASPTGRAGAAPPPLPGCQSIARVAAEAMTGVEAEQEFDFDFLFEFKHSDEGGGGSRRDGPVTSEGAGGGMLRGTLLALPRSGGRKAASFRGERGGEAGSPGRTGQPGPGRRLSPQPRREAASGTAASGVESCPGGQRSSGNALAAAERGARGDNPAGRRCGAFRSLELF